MGPLTEAQILARARQGTRAPIPNLSCITNLNLWGQDLTDVSVLRTMTNLEVLSLAINSIKSLSAFRDLTALKELYLRRNQISDIGELQHLRRLSNLNVLWLSENPIASHPQYRQFVISLLPNLRKLDDTDVTRQEREMARATVPSLQVSASPSVPQQHYRRPPLDEDHLQGGGLQVVSVPHFPVHHSPTPRPLQSPLNGLGLKSAEAVAPQSTPSDFIERPAAQRVSSSVQLGPVSAAPSPAEKNDSEAAIQKRSHRPTWLTRAAETGDIKQSIRAAAIAPLGATVESPTDDTAWIREAESSKSKKNNILFAVLSLIKELDRPSLLVVAHEISNALDERK
ncbi:hypothetical protein HDU88_003804 [Geranomyces variabilis]|nr:hypothetical protein HDU88_003804 [Geranomyces variabilis]